MTTVAVTEGLKETVYDQDILDEALELEDIWASVSKYREGHYTNGKRAAGSLDTTTTHAESLSICSSGYTNSTVGSGSPLIVATLLSESLSYDSNDDTIDTFNFVLPRMFSCGADKGSERTDSGSSFIAKHSLDDLKNQGGRIRTCKGGPTLDEVHDINPGSFLLTKDSLDDLKEQGGNFLSCKAMPSIDESMDHNALFTGLMKTESDSILSTFDEDDDEATEELKSRRSSYANNREDYINCSKCEEFGDETSSGELSSETDFLNKDIYPNEIKSFVSTLDDNEEDEDEDSVGTSTRAEINGNDVIGTFQNLQKLMYKKKLCEKDPLGNKFPVLNVNFPLSPLSSLAQPFSPSTIRTETEVSFLEVPVDQFGQEEYDNTQTKNRASLSVRNPSCPVRQAKQSAFICSSLLCALSDVYTLHSLKSVESIKKKDAFVDNISMLSRSVLGDVKSGLHDLVEINIKNNCVELILFPDDDGHEREEIKPTPHLKALLDDSGKKKPAKDNSKWKSNELAQVAADLLLNLVDANVIKSPSPGTLLIQAAQQQADRISLPPRNVLLVRGVEAQSPPPMIVSHKIRIPSSYPECLPQHLIFQIEIDRTTNGIVKEVGRNVSCNSTIKPVEFRADDLAEVAAHLARLAASHLKSLSGDENMKHMKNEESPRDPKETCTFTHAPQILTTDFLHLPDLAKSSSSNDSSVATEPQYQVKHKDVTKIHEHLNIVEVDHLTTELKETNFVEPKLTYHEWLVLHTAKERTC